MDENYQNKTESKSIVVEDVKWVINKRSNLWVPKRKKRTGFEDKTSWDRLLLCAQVVGAFAIPLSIIALIIGVWQFNTQQFSDNQKTVDQQITAFRNLKDQQQQTTLETYLDRMSDLLFTQHLNTSKVGDEVRHVARARTLTALQNLNSVRKGVLLQFLYESDLIREPSEGDTSGNNPIIDLSDANLSDANLSHAKLSRADLSFADLSGADLSHADLIYANLFYSDLSHADLSHADLSFTFLSHVDLSFANLSFAGLSDALLVFANLIDANLSFTDLSGADLSRANLSGADLSHTNLGGANLSHADLSFADLSGARVTQEQLVKAKSLRGATMPDGSKHP